MMAVLVLYLSGAAVLRLPYPSMEACEISRPYVIQGFESEMRSDGADSSRYSMSCEVLTGPSLSDPS
jgi:hypothetical protein